MYQTHLFNIYLLTETEIKQSCHSSFYISGIVIHVINEIFEQVSLWGTPFRMKRLIFGVLSSGVIR